MDTLITRVIEEIKEKRKNILNGGINCIPSPFPSFRNDFIGTMQKRYYLITAHQKAGKTNLTSFIFIFNNLLYAYYHPDQIRLKIFYYPLEETKEDITLRFMSYILFKFSGRKIRINTEDLESTNEHSPLSQDIINILESEEYMKIFDFFQKTVIFEESTNPTGVWKDMNSYAKEHGKIHQKEYETVNRETGEIVMKKKFDYYEPDDPKEYVEIIWDHVSLTSLERNMDLRNTIAKLSEYFVALKNMYSYIPIVIQQQSTETQNLDAFKANKIEPTVAGLADCKYTARDCDEMITIINPFAFEMPSYLHYNVKEFGDNIRFMKMNLKRHGRKNGTLPLFFDGAVCDYQVLPDYKDTKALESIYNYIGSLKQEERHHIALFCVAFIKSFKSGVHKLLH